MKRVCFCTGSYGLFCLTSLVLLLQATNINAQKTPLKDITEAMNTEYPMLKEGAGKNKKILPLFEKQILFALSFFPEFKETKIHFKLKKSSNGIISTRPSWGSIFRRSSKRTYIVIINDSTGGRSFPVFRNGGVNGQVGILGHELCHILYFNKKTGLGLIGLGIRHLSTKFMDGFENRTDSVDIERGLGYQLIDWNIYLRKAFGMQHPEEGPDPFFGPQKRERYMSPTSIRKAIAKNPLYNQH
ncbi:MAG: hypothetical protein ABIQ88_13410 [Chitinophagaceae bacterium]